MFTVLPLDSVHLACVIAGAHIIVLTISILSDSRLPIQFMWCRYTVV